MAGNDSGIPSAADVIVVGSGSGGAVVARRLVDAGARRDHRRGRRAGRLKPAIHDPAAAVRAVGQRAGLGLPDGAAGRLRRARAALAARQGARRSSALNGMIYARGHRSDYDTWAYLGNDGWGYDDVLPLFKRSEDFDRGGPSTTGSAGRCTCSRSTSPTRSTRRSSPPRRRPGSPSTTTTTARARRRRVRQLNIKDGIRQSVATAFLAPVAGAPNLTC